MKLGRFVLVILLLVVKLVYLVSAKSNRDNNEIILSSVRQLANGLKMMRDLIFLGAMGLPFIAMIGLGSIALAPYVRPFRPVSPRIQQQTDDGVFPGRRTLAVHDSFNALNNLEEVFTEYDIKEPECRLRMVCEVFQYSLRGEPMDRIVHSIRVGRYLHSRSVSPPDKFLRYREAARSGRAKQDCSKIYGQCTKSMFFFIRNKLELVSSLDGNS